MTLWEWDPDIILFYFIIFLNCMISPVCGILKKTKQPNSQSERTDWRLPEAEGVGVGKMREEVRRYSLIR